ncbi:MAG: hypothetical protein KGZ88_05985 [Methylomicrobium sp.]|nr:hypothetical protein [Methylomicrobium sp.]
MKRNQYGLNLDEGIALTSKEDFDLLYLESDSEVENRLVNWIKNSSSSVIFGGQIGCGKTTTIERALHIAEKRPDIICHFDRNHINPSPIDTWLIVFAEVARFSAPQAFSIIIEHLPGIQKILGVSTDEWKETVKLTLLEKYSPKALIKHQKFKELLEPLLEYLPGILKTILQEIESILGRRIFILASGVDKFELGTSAYISLSEPLTVLASFKTLFEVNAVHLFANDRWTQGLKKEVLAASSPHWIEAMFNKRLGVYAQVYKNQIPSLATYSGGIPRQALRLLDHFIIQQKHYPNQNDAIIHSVEAVNRDFFSFAKKPKNEFLKAVAKQNYLETTLVSITGDQETAMRAVFGNWIILKQPQQDSRWQVLVNPVIKSSFADLSIDDPEMLLLKKYADQQGMSAHGLDIDIQMKEWQETLRGVVDHPLALNITEILDTISSSLLSKNREDRIIVAYENHQNAEIVRAYFEAKSNTYEYQVWKHIAVLGGKQQSPLNEILNFFSDETIDIYSVDFVGDFTNEQLSELNLRRDTFIDKQLIWWIPKNKLAQYLVQWTQLRQLFQIFILEDDISKSLKIEEIDADIEFMQDLAESENTAEFSYVSNLKKVLNYLKADKQHAA